MQKERLQSHGKIDPKENPRWRAEFFAPVFREATTSLPEVMDIHSQNRKTRILATMVPDELVYANNLSKKEVKPFVGIVFLADVSGITLLHGMYKYAGQGGSIGLNATLNAYFGYMVQAVYSYGGDVFKITENGLLAVWNVRKDELIFNTLHEVITCGLRIQEAVGRFTTSVNVTLKLKVAIAAGNLTFVIIGANNCYHYSMAGPPMEDAKLAKNVCLPGDLVLAGSAWGHCNPSCYEYVIKDTYNVKIQRILLSGKQIARGKSFLEEKARKKMFNVEERVSGYWKRIDPQDDLIIAARPAINEAVLRQLGKNLRTFISPPAVRLIDDSKPLEYLTEPRRVTTMFINVIPSKCSMHDLIRIVDDIFILLSSLEYTPQYVGLPISSGLTAVGNEDRKTSHFLLTAPLVPRCLPERPSTLVDRGGHVVRVSLFQKDVSFLTVFGLQDSSNGSDCKNALLTGRSMRNSIKNFYGVQKVSVGVTTGMAHCGIVGHVLRREYIVVGSPLQRAIELAGTCVEKVTCDLNTILRSDLPRSKFLLQENKALKGVGLNSIYEYVDDAWDNGETNPELMMGYPILGRDPEMNTMSLMLDDIGLADREHAGILLKGKAGSGKSRLLDGFITLIRSREIQTVRVSLTPDYAIAPYSVIYPILTEILDIDEYSSIDVREQKMVKRLCHVVTPQDFCYLNELMRVRFPMSKRCSLETELERQSQTMKILQEIFLKSKTRRCILIDGIHNIDPMSWQLLSLVLDANYMLLIMSIEIPLDNPTPKSITRIYSDKRITHLNLKPISSECITALACQILNVQAIPQCLERELILRTNNNPSHCQALLTDVLGHGAFQRVEITPKKATEYQLIFSPVQMLSKLPFDTLPEDVAPPLPWDRRLKVYACLISNQYRFQYSQNSGIDDMMLNTYTKLSPYEQGLLKSSAILGVFFTRYMLQLMMPNFSNFHTTKAITHMFNLRILGCASLVIPNVIHTGTINFCMLRNRSTFSDSRFLLYCRCSDPQISDAYSRRTSEGILNDELPWYSRCKFLAFKMPRFQQLIYDLIPEDEKKEFHVKAIELYKVEAHKCIACGGGNFLDIPTRPKVSRVPEGRKYRPIFQIIRADLQQNKRIVVTKPSDAPPSFGRKDIELKTRRESPTPSPRGVSIQDESKRPSSANKPISGPNVHHHEAQEHGKPRMDSNGSEGRRRVSILPFYAEPNAQTNASSESSLEASVDLSDDRVAQGSKFCEWMKYRFFNNSSIKPSPEPNTKTLRVSRLAPFRSVDFRNCQCSLILNNIYKRLLYHSKNTGNIGKHIQYLIDYSAGLIRIAEYPHAIKTLTRADDLNKVYEKYGNDTEKSATSRVVTKGIILSLLGETYFQLGYYDKSRHLTLDEMAIYGYMLSTKKISVYQGIIANEHRQLIHQWFPGSPMAKLSGKDATENSRISACISRLSSIFMTNDQPKLAKLTVLVSLNISSKCKDQPVTELCSYKLAMLYYRQFGDMGFCRRLEKSALRIIVDQFAWDNLNGVLVVADVYAVIFYSKLIRGELKMAIEYGFDAIQIAGTLHTVKFRLAILPILIQAVVQAKRIPEAVDLLRELAYLAQEDVDMSATIWYYALCLDLLLDAGVSVESVQTCQEFARKLLDSNGQNLRAIIRDPDCSKRLMTNMWLLLTRMGIDSAKYELPRDAYVSGIRHDNYSNLWTVLKAIECRMLNITYFLNYKKGNTLPDIHGDITELLRRLTKASKISGFVKPRLSLLKAYMNIIRGRMSWAKRALAIAQQNAQRQESLLMEVTIELHRREEYNAEEDGNLQTNVRPEYSVWEEVILLHTRVAWKNFVIISTITLQCQLILYDISFRGRTSFPQQSQDLSDGKMGMDSIYAFDVLSAIMYKKWTSLSSTYGQPTRPIMSLVLDVISLLPFDFIYRLVTDNGYENLPVSYLLSTNRLLRIHRLFSFFNTARNSVGQRTVFVRILEFLIILFLMTGITVSVMIHAVDMVNLDLNWLRIIEERSSYPTTEFEWCIVSYYVMMTQISGHGLPEVQPGIYSFAFILIVLISLWMLQAFGIAYLTDIILQIDYSRSLFQREMHLIVNYLDDINAAKETRETVTEYYNYFWKTQGDSEFNIINFDMYPSIFLKECALELAWDAYKHSHLFRDLPIPFLRNLAILFDREYYRPGEVIIQKYDQKSKLIYVVTGVVQILSEEDDKSPLLSFSGGTIICETTLILGHRCLCNVVARTEVALNVLHREKFADLMVYRYRDVYRIIQSRVRFRYWKALRMVTIGAALQKNKSHIVGVPACTDVAWLKQTLTVLQHRHGRHIAKKERKDFQVDAIFAATDFRYTFANLDMLVISDDIAIMTEQVCLNNGHLPWIFSPQSSILNYWEGFVLVCCVALSLIIPTYASQPKYQTSGLRFFVNIVCPVYLVDLIITSSTAIHENDVVRVEIIHIISRRMHNVSYWADIVAAFPADWIFILFGSHDHRMLAYCMINRLVKIYKFNGFFSSLENRMILSSYKVRVIKYTFCMMILTYFTSTCILLLTCPNGECEPSGWLQTFIASANEDMKEKSVAASILYASQILIGIGTDVIVPRSIPEYLISIPLLIVGAVIFIYVISSVAASQILHGFTKSWLRFNTMNIALLLNMNKVSESIQTRVFRYLEMEWLENDAYVLTFERGILDIMTPKLRKELSAERLASVVRKVDIFQEMEEECIKEICSVCKLGLLPPQEIVGYRGNECRAMYIVEKGHCQVWRHTEMAPINIKKGKALYDLEMLCDLKNFHTVTTVTHVSVMQIVLKDLMQVLAQFPMEKTILMKAVDKFKKSDEFKKLLTIQGTLPRQNMMKEIEGKWERSDKLGKTKANSKTQDPETKKSPNTLKTHVSEERSFKETVLMFFLAKSTINPDGRFVKIWEGVRCTCAYVLIMVYSADAILSQIIPKAPIITLMIALNIMMLIDMYIRLHFQFYNSHRILVTHPLSTANNYVRTGFIVDVVAIFPLEYFFISHDSQGEKMILLCRLNRLLMAHRMIGALRYYYSSPYLSKYINCVMFLPIIILTGHVFACGLLFEFCDVGDDIDTSQNFVSGIYCSPNNVRIEYESEDRITPLQMYAYSLLYVFATITRIGAVNLQPVKFAAILCVLMMTVVSFLLLIVVTTYIVSTISRRDATLTAYQQQMMILMSFLKEKQVSVEFRNEVVNYFETFWILRRGTSIMEQMQLFPPALKEDVLWCVYGPSLTKVGNDDWSSPIFVDVHYPISKCTSLEISFFDDISRTVNDIKMKSPGFSMRNESFFRSLFTHMEVKFYSKGSEIMTLNLVHSSVYFIHSGWAEAVGPDGTRIAVLGCGSIFGNFTGSSTMRQTCSIMTRTHVEAIVIKSADFFNLMMHHHETRKGFLSALELNTDYLKAETDGEEEEVVNSTKRKTSSFILLPNTGLVVIWGTFSMLFSCGFAFAICLYHVAVATFPGYWMILLYTIDFVFLVKIGLVFFTAFEDDLGDYVVDKSLIARRFRKSKFGLYLHIFTIIPFEVLSLFISDAKARSDAIPWLRMNRVLRLILVINYFRTACDRLNINISRKRINYAAVLLVGLLHTAACLTTISQNVTSDATTILEGLWIYFDNLYTVSLMFTITAPKIVAKNSQEALFLVFISQVFYIAHAILLGEVCAVIDVNQFIMNEYERRITFFRDRVTRMNLTYALRISAWRYGSKLWDVRRGQQIPSLISEAPIYLQYAVAYDMYAHHFLGSEIFGNLHEDFLRQLAFHCKDNVFFPGDKILNVGDVDETMYFIDKGTVEVSASEFDGTEENLLTSETLGPGKSFGIVQGLYEGIPHTATYTAKTTTHIIYLYRLHWIYLLNYFPVSTINLYRSATRIIRSDGLEVYT